MPVDPETFAQRIAAAGVDDGRLPVPDLSMADWDIFPLESAGLRVRSMQSATIPEPPRFGEGGTACGACSGSDDAAVWTHDRIGDGGSHLHPFFFARPEGFLQLRGSFLTFWDDLLPPVPTVEYTADALAVATALVGSFGGTVNEELAPDR